MQAANQWLSTKGALNAIAGLDGALSEHLKQITASTLSGQGAKKKKKGMDEAAVRRLEAAACAAAGGSLEVAVKKLRAAFHGEEHKLAPLKSLVDDFTKQHRNIRCAFMGEEAHGSTQLYRVLAKVTYAHADCDALRAAIDDLPPSDRALSARDSKKRPVPSAQCYTLPSSTQEPRPPLPFLTVPLSVCAGPKLIGYEGAGAAAAGATAASVASASGVGVASAATKGVAPGAPAPEAGETVEALQGQLERAEKAVRMKQQTSDEATKRASELADAVSLADAALACARTAHTEHVQVVGAAATAVTEALEARKRLKERLQKAVAEAEAAAAAEAAEEAAAAVSTPVAATDAIPASSMPASAPPSSSAPSSAPPSWHKLRSAMRDELYVPPYLPLQGPLRTHTYPLTHLQALPGFGMQGAKQGI